MAAFVATCTHAAWVAVALDTREALERTRALVLDDGEDREAAPYNGFFAVPRFFAFLRFCTAARGAKTFSAR